MRATEGDEWETWGSGWERGVGRLVSGAGVARLGELGLLQGLTGARLSELEFHLGHALGSELELSLHVLHGSRVIAVGGRGAAGRRRVGERVGALRGNVVRKRNAAVMHGVLLLIELGHEFAEDVVVFFTFGVGLGLL